MAVERQELTRLQNNFYRDHYHKIILALMISIVVLLALMMLDIYLLKNKTPPEYFAKNPEGNTLQLAGLDSPNLLPQALLRWASQAAVAAYSFDFANYDKQILLARPYFTPPGWQGYLNDLARANVVGTVRQNQLYVNSVVAGTPVIVNQGDNLGVYTWRVQLPFLVTYLSAGAQSQKSYLVDMLIVRVPTAENPQGIGIDRFVMR